MDRTGRIYGRLTVIDYGGFSREKQQTFWVCRCDCGKVVNAIGKELNRGSKKSCGCLQRDVLIKRNTKHGWSKTSTYMSWSSAKSRCTNSNDDFYFRYGGRGIKMCDRWLISFENFLADMGKKPTPRHSLDRINNDGNYEPSNCRWATHKQQANNKRNNCILNFMGVNKTLAQWAEERGINKGTLWTRIYELGWRTSDALTKI